MKFIIAGTNRPNSRSFEVARILESLYKDDGQSVEIINLADVPLALLDGSQYSENQPQAIKDLVDKISNSEGLIVVCPEYNGSMPGALKYFIDHWKYPESFEYRPVCFVGLGGRFGGLRPVEHLQQVFGYRNAFIYPDRVFLSNIWSILKEGKITDETCWELLIKQTKGFGRYVKALQSEGLDAMSLKTQ